MPAKGYFGEPNGRWADAAKGAHWSRSPTMGTSWCFCASATVCASPGTAEIEWLNDIGPSQSAAARTILQACDGAFSRRGDAFRAEVSGPAASRHARPTCLTSAYPPSQPVLTAATAHSAGPNACGSGKAIADNHQRRKPKWTSPSADRSRDNPAMLSTDQLRKIRAVLFDLDGTLLAYLADLAAAANAALAECGYPPVDAKLVEDFVGKGIDVLIQRWPQVHRPAGNRPGIRHHGASPTCGTTRRSTASTPRLIPACSLA